MISLVIDVSFWRRLGLFTSFFVRCRLKLKSFSISELIDLQGTVQEGYRVSEVKVSPERIRVAARNEVLEQMNELPLDRTINLDNLNETTVFQIKVQKPSEDAVLSNDTITVTVEVERKE